MATSINLATSLQDAETLVLRAVGTRCGTRPTSLQEAWAQIAAALAPVQMGSSSLVCLADAQWCADRGMVWESLNRTLDALSYMGGAGWIDAVRKLRSLRLAVVAS